MDSAQIRAQVDIVKPPADLALEWEGAGCDECGAQQTPHVAVLHVRGVGGALKGWFWRFDLDQAVHQDYLPARAEAGREGVALDPEYGSLQTYVDGSVRAVADGALDTLGAFGAMVSGVCDGWVKPVVSYEGDGLLAVWTLSYGLSRRFYITDSEGGGDAILSYRCQDDKDILCGRAERMMNWRVAGPDAWLDEAKRHLIAGEKSVGSFVKLLTDQGVGSVK